MGRYSRSPSRSRSRDGGGGDEDGFRVHVADLGVDCSQREIEKTFGKFGEIKEVWLARNPPCFAFVVFKRRGDAEDSIREIDGRVVCGSRVRCTWARPRTRGRPPVGRNDDSFRCYQCGEKGHFSRDCRNTRGSGAGYRSSGGGRRGYDDDYRRSKPARRSRSRSRGGSRTRHRRSSYSRSRSRSISRGRKSGDVDNGIRNGAY